VYSTNRPDRLKTLLKVFWQFKTFLKVFCFCKTLLKFICWVCSRKTLLCFAISLTIVITSVPYIPYCYAQNIVSTKDMTSAHIGHPLCHCLRHVGAAVTAAMAAASTVSAAIATAFWLIVVCPCAASALATVACPHRCCHWLSTPLPLLPQPQTPAPCSFRRNRVMFKIVHLK